MKWHQRLHLTRLSKLIIPVALCFLVIFAGFTVYGNKVGNFVVNVQGGESYLALSMTEDLSDKTSRIAVPGLKSQDLATLGDIRKDIYKGVGAKNDGFNRYIAFSFYLLNVSDKPVDYLMSLTILDSTKNLSDIVRVQIIVGEGERQNIYAKKEPTEEEKATVEKYGGYKSVDFLSDTQVAEKSEAGFAVGDKIKYTVVIWLEGWDKLATDAVKGGKIKMRMEFTAL